MTCSLQCPRICWQPLVRRISPLVVADLAEYPPEIASLLGATNVDDRNAAWARFVAQHSKLLVGTCRVLGGDHDVVMDRYAYVLEHLRRDDFRRLRPFVGDGRCKFSTWLVVIARRLCLDHHRARFGRLRADEVEPEKQLRRQSRRDLAMLVSSQDELEELADTEASDPEAELIAAEQIKALEVALDDLESRDRLLLRLRFADALGAPEIARLMGFPSPFHVYRRLNHVFEALRRALRRTGIEDAVP